MPRVYVSPRKHTNKLIEMAEAGEISWEGIARECLTRMSDDDVGEMAEEMDWTEDLSWMEEK